MAIELLGGEQWRANRDPAQPLRGVTDVGEGDESLRESGGGHGKDGETRNEDEE
jgi:hypothetical protein